MSALNKQALVLNRSWQAVNVTSVARALILLWNGTAQVVDPQSYQTYNWSDWAALRPEDDELAVNAVSFMLRVPEVITLVTYDKIAVREVALSRRNIYRRDKYACQYCGARPARDALTIDHVLPCSRGGKTEWSNCVLACLDCNRRKANKTLREANLRLRKKPKQPLWSPLYSLKTLPVESWKKFISAAYWQVELQ